MKKSIGHKLKSSDSLIPLPKNDAPSSYRCVSFSLPEDTDWATSFWGLLSSLTLWFSWERDDLKRGKIVAREWMRIINEARKQWEGIGDNACGDDGNNCHDYPLNAPFISFAPQNPFTQPDYIPSGFIAPPFKVIGENDLIGLALGLQVGDVYTYYDRFPVGSLPTVIPPDGFARFRLTYTAPAEIEIHFLQAPGCGVVYMTRDSMLASSEWLSLGKDLISVPPENVVELIWEYEDTGEGEHYIDVTFLPVVNEVAPFIYYGGGIRKVVICGEQTGVDMDVRQNSSSPCTLEKSVDGEIWIPFADLQLCPPKIRQHGGVIEYFHPTEGWKPIDDQPPTVKEGDKFPEPKPRTEETETDRICAASANVALVLNMMHSETVSYTGALFAPSIAAGIISVLAPAIFFPPSMIVTLPIVVTALAVIALLNTESFTDVIKKQLRCILIENATDNGSGTITFSHGDILNELLTRGASDSMWLALYYYALIMQEGGMNLAGAVDYETSAECPDCDAWCYEWDFTVSDGGFYKPLAEYGQWVSGVGWEGTYAAPMSVEALYILKDFPVDANVTQITMYYTKTAGGGANNVNRFRARNNGAVQIATDTNTIGTNLSKTANGNAVCDQLYVDINQGTLGGSIIVRKIQVKGTGINPFGSDNCA